jgi:hypothetical protein
MSEILLFRRGNEEFKVIEFDRDKTIIHNEFLKNMMEDFGIRIPALSRSAFNNQDIVKYPSPLFQRAFKEIYYPLVLNAKHYIWTNA